MGVHFSDHESRKVGRNVIQVFRSDAFRTCQRWLSDKHWHRVEGKNLRFWKYVSRIWHINVRVRPRECHTVIWLALYLRILRGLWMQSHCDALHASAFVPSWNSADSVSFVSVGCRRDTLLIQRLEKWLDEGGRIFVFSQRRRSLRYLKTCSWFYASFLLILGHTIVWFR